jgi:hypothetical protein
MIVLALGSLQFRIHDACNHRGDFPWTCPFHSDLSGCACGKTRPRVVIWWRSLQISYVFKSARYIPSMEQKCRLELLNATVGGIQGRIVVPFSSGALAIFLKGPKPEWKWRCNF